MIIEVPVLLASLGIILLEISEAAAVGIALYPEYGSRAFLFISLGVIPVLLIAFTIGIYITYLPVLLIRMVAAFLLLYFGIRLARSARKSYKREKSGNQNYKEEFSKGVVYTGLTVGAIEAFEASIVLVALMPINYESTLLGTILGLIIVAVLAYVLRVQVRKIKQSTMKVAVSGLLLSFGTFWLLETFIVISDFVLLPLFFAYFLAIFYLIRSLS
ncbi:MAG: hypothetical protein RXN92_04130 [Thermoplasmatales archaeon]